MYCGRNELIYFPDHTFLNVSDIIVNKGESEYTSSLRVSHSNSPIGFGISLLYVDLSMIFASFSKSMGRGGRVMKTSSTAINVGCRQRVLQ